MIHTQRLPGWRESAVSSSALHFDSPAIQVSEGLVGVEKPREAFPAIRTNGSGDPYLVD
jgi:hypothetical protein